MSTVERVSGCDRRAVPVRKIMTFGPVGGVGFGLDLGIYRVMYGMVGLGALTAKIISTSLTSCVAYYLHRHVSFAHRARTATHRELTMFLILSAVSLLLGLLFIGSVRYGLGHTNVVALQVANVFAIGAGAGFGFWADKRWGFLPLSRTSAEAPMSATGQPALYISSQH